MITGLLPWWDIEWLLEEADRSLREHAAIMKGLEALGIGLRAIGRAVSA